MDVLQGRRCCRPGVQVTFDNMLIHASRYEKMKVKLIMCYMLRQHLPADSGV